MRQSKLFTKTQKNISEEEVSINAQLLLRAGFVDRLVAGVYSYLPLGLRTLTKIEHIIREEMNLVGGQEILMPSLHPKENWEATGRWDTVDVLFKLIGSGEKEYALGATHEEIVTPLLKKSIFSYKDLPRAVYQVQTKFRNEARAKSGILRGREFRMKDLYSFHTSQADLDLYYQQVSEAYFRVYTRCGLQEQTYLTFASGGAFSQYSHEYQTVTEAGEDNIYLCQSCNVAVNQEILADLNHACPQCKKTDLQQKKAIEVGNIFKLGTRFSEPIGLTYHDESGIEQPVIMGCYGIGSSRLLGTIVEVHHDEKGIIWPKEIAPFQVHVISLAQEAGDVEKANALYEKLLEQKIEVLFDDRPDIRAGEKFADADLIGLPWRAVVSAKTLAAGSVEMKARTSAETVLVPLAEISAWLQKQLA